MPKFQSSDCVKAGFQDEVKSRRWVSSALHLTSSSGLVHRTAEPLSH
jgi:hypothetical protein